MNKWLILLLYSILTIKTSNDVYKKNTSISNLFSENKEEDYFIKDEKNKEIESEENYNNSSNIVGKAEPEKQKIMINDSNSHTNPWEIFEEEGAILLNFIDADIYGLLKYFETNFKVLFITDDAIQPISNGGKSLNKSKINFSSNRPMSYKEAWNVLITLLEVAGVTLQPGSMERTYRLVSLMKDSPFGYTKGQLPLYVNVDPEELPISDFRVRYIYIVKNTSLEAAHNIIKSVQSPMSPEPILIPEMNAILMTDRAYNLKVTLKIISELDQLTTPETLVIIKLKKADATKIAELYKTIIKEEGLSATSPRLLGPKRTEQVEYFDPSVKIIPDTRTNSLIALGPIDSIKKVEEFIKEYEDKSPRTPYIPTRIYTLKYTQAEAVEKLLNQAIAFKSDTEAGKAGGVRDGEKYFSNTSIIAEKSTNSLIISSPDEEYEHIYSILKEIDIEQPQVKLDVIIMSIDINKAKELGSQIRNKEGALGKNINFQTGVLDSDTGVVSNYNTDSSGNVVSGGSRLLGNLLQLITGGSANPGTSAISLGKDMNGVWGLIRTLQTETEAHIMSDPFIVTSNKYEAYVKVGEERRIPATSITNSNNTSQSFTSDSAAIEIKIIPQINDRDIVNLTVDLKDAVFTSNAGDNTASSGNKRESNINTSLSVQNNEVVALAGLTHKGYSIIEKKVPWISKIPLVGWLFKKKSVTETKSMIVTFIQAHIVTSDKDEIKREKHIKRIEEEWFKKSKSNSMCPISRTMFKEEFTNERNHNILSEFIKSEEIKEDKDKQKKQNKNKKKRLRKSKKNRKHMSAV